jgi:phosphoserine phosphatase
MMAPEERTERIAKLFASVARSVFEEVARTVPLMPGAVELVLALRKSGYRVGIISDSFRVAAEIIRRRVFADFSIAHMMRFRHGVATGEVTLSPAMQHENGCEQHRVCKLNSLLHLSEHLSLSRERILAVGDNDTDACMLRAAGRSVAYQPKSKLVEESALHVVHGNLLEVLECLGDSTN